MQEGRWQTPVASLTNAAPDGYTLLLAFSVNAINATLYDNLNFNFIRDIAPVASIAREPEIMVVNPSVPAVTVVEFIAYAKANPHKLNMGWNPLPCERHLRTKPGCFRSFSRLTMRSPKRKGAPA